MSISMNSIGCLVHRSAKGVLMATLSLALACVPVGDSGARLYGRIELEWGASQKCTLSLFEAKEDFVVGRAEVGPSFDESFVVAPGEAEYYATVSCEGARDEFRSSILRLGTIATYREGTNLGTITLR